MAPKNVKTDFSKHDIDYLVELSKLTVTESEETTITSQLTQTLEAVNTMESIDTSQVEPTYQTNGLENQFQAPQMPHTQLTQKEALSGAPKTDGTHFITTTDNTFTA
ncbi:MAG: aspartyl/glutamyl-tRNA amidotransferase subunit C [Candidatus Roizmanbacteria bacterium]|nr:aspartyl/glutamyl-tRNA amidotransferase subunit C [Candidatus Roizmanbacteria bacterium]